MDLISPFSMDVVNKALDGHYQRHQAITSNLANVDTPNYKRRDVTFEGNLQDAVKQHQEIQAAGGKPLLGRPQMGIDNDTPLQMQATRQEHYGAGMPMFQSLDEIQPQWTSQDTTEYRNDNNGVDVENEMVQLSKNSGRFQALTNLQSRQIRLLRTAIDRNGM